MKSDVSHTKPFCMIPGCNNDCIDDRLYCAVHVNNPHLDKFMAEVRDLIEGKAKQKGYNEVGDDENPLMEFDLRFFPGHAMGEIVYKAVRYMSKRDKSDLAKVAAWAYLVWRHDQCER